MYEAAWTDKLSPNPVTRGGRTPSRHDSEQADDAAAEATATITTCPTQTLNAMKHLANHAVFQEIVGLAPKE
jgi:hypothetical protein